ncbi:lipoprotein-anchoring transpeptidase ErfK/SrfK [Mycolicibacterium sp. BK556]|uniref:L,D-transpeptidase n=1 Tax=unclassified Mycolicibacterium TaxID=2636767 RepID=UPI0016192DF1|nr:MULTISPECIES: L,D-transpeptidase [unclassified Mycolicibacterium]MBB3603949.1 lipoprotein-anchoring transpeptidase ErfK/SrfK [Mycolicibacterium sp. BK556]MBB3634144.1 lipoprotein-anchoring transpeptidase ErfK/SrfK [Mycolicibacterium sp. BK607]MBB3751726.1 lipoprotein-anchoring transpeptidase ErfK/SrfK [Mycolicibacterium sp. BK634]
MARAVRRAFAAAGIAVLAMATTAPTSVAAVAPSFDGGTVASVAPTNGQVVGVAMPITVTFTKPVIDRWAAQQSISVTSPANVAGRYDWLDDKTVQFVPAQYWPAHSEITMMAGGLPRTFGTGSIVLGVADISAHTFTVSIDGQVARQMPASMGKPRHPTPVGSFTALEKQSTVVMDSRTIGIPLSDPEGYKLTVNDAVRVTWGGVYVHSAPWSVGSQGYANVSHGCINLSPDNAAWYFDQVHIGDPIVINA